jgi:hypothetical protein
MANETTVEPARFWRGKLPTIVWDKRNDRMLCDLSAGHITTRDAYTIDVLQKNGYIQIPLDATRPPDIVEPIQPAESADIKPLPAGMSGHAATKKSVVVEKPKTKPKNTPSKKPKKTKAPLKRRSK